MKFLDAIKILVPAILSVVPGAGKFVPLILAAIGVAEETGKPGHEKKQIALDYVDVASQAANTIAGKQVIDPVEAKQVANQTIDTIVSVTNMVSAVKAS